MKNCEMILAGFGGQGILFTGKILAFAAMLKDKKLSWLPSYGPEMRGGTANCHVIIDDEPIGSPIVTRPNILVAMNKPSLDKFENTVSDGGYVFINTSLIDRKSEREDVNEICVNATETAHNMGNKSLANMVMLGAVLKKTELFTIDEIEYTMKKSLESLTLQDNHNGFRCILQLSDIRPDSTLHQFHVKSQIVYFFTGDITFHIYGIQSLADITLSNFHLILSRFQLFYLIEQLLK